ncbi:MAG: acetyl-CoA carboxylase biotin carboxyl carrier protein subunit, partial [Nocardioidaceae bacterium]
VEVAHQGQRYVFERPDAVRRGSGHGPTPGDGSLVAPMPGTMLSVSVEPGQHVEEGTVLGVLEAMKMELALKAPHAGRVTTVGCAAGEQVSLGSTLFVVTAEEG